MKVELATSKLAGAALRRWEYQVQEHGYTHESDMSWTEFASWMVETYSPDNAEQQAKAKFWSPRMEGSELEDYTTRFKAFTTLCPMMVSSEERKLRRFVDGLVPKVQRSVYLCNPVNMQHAVQLAQHFTDQAVIQGVLPTTEVAGEAARGKRKLGDLESSGPNTQEKQSPKNYQGSYPKCSECKYHHWGNCSTFKCSYCGVAGHTKKGCRKKILNGGEPSAVTHVNCFMCGLHAHFWKDCPLLATTKK